MSSSLPSPGNVVQVGRDSAADPVPARASVAIGFGSPADDTGVTRLDLDDILVKHPQATFLMRVAGDAMREAGIDSGDVVLVDRAITPAHGHVVIAVVDDEFVCRRLFKQGDDLLLQAADGSGADIVPHDGQELQVWGVVTHAIKAMRV
jgi:DNA polymerase V